MENITMSVEKELRDVLKKWKKNDALDLNSDTKLEDLNIDSLDLVEVMFEIEEKFDVSLSQSHQEAREASFSDLAGWIERQLALKHAAAISAKARATSVRA